MKRLIWLFPVLLLMACEAHVALDSKPAASKAIKHYVAIGQVLGCSRKEVQTATTTKEGKKSDYTWVNLVVFKATDGKTFFIPFEKNETVIYDGPKVGELHYHDCGDYTFCFDYWQTLPEVKR